MRALDRKLVRDLVRLRGQVVTIALVVAAGISAWVCLRSTYESLLATRDADYASGRFGHVFCRLVRAPARVEAELSRIEGVERVYPRLVERGLLPLASSPEPAVAEVVSLPIEGEAPLNHVHVVSGRLPHPGRGDEVLLLEAFASRHGIGLGSRLSWVLEGRRRVCTVVGIAVSPEYVFATTEGALEAEGRSAVLWMARDALAAATDKAGVFDDVVLQLGPHASERAVIAEVDRRLAPYGGRGAFGRSRQPSNALIDGELVQLRAFSTVAPLLFLAVTAFLVHLVLGRLVNLQRGQIAALKALGYRDREVAQHYLALVSVVVSLGAVIGVASGAWLGRGMLALYLEFFRFSEVRERLSAPVVLVGVLGSLGAALVGAGQTVRRIAALPPAEAMRPEAPTEYRLSWFSAGPLGRLVPTSGRMVLRELERHPIRACLSSLGIALGIAVVIVGWFGRDALEALIAHQFERSMREDLEVRFLGPRPARVVRTFGAMPGVLRAEGGREVPGRVRSGARVRDVRVVVHPEGATLRALLDADGAPGGVPSGGTLLTGKLAEVLGVSVGDVVELELVEGAHPVRWVSVTGAVEEPYGLALHLTTHDLDVLLREQHRVTSVWLRVDPWALGAVRRRLATLPGVFSVTRRTALVAHFRAQTGRTMGTTTFVLTLFAAVIAAGVVYNHARVALSLRARDLASLRVLGFTRGEISSVLLGELSVHGLLAIPVGAWLGARFAQAVLATVDAERYRLSASVSRSTYAFAITVTLAAGLFSALLVRRRLDRLDLLAVLKARE